MHWPLDESPPATTEWECDNCGYTEFGFPDFPLGEGRCKDEKHADKPLVRAKGKVADGQTSD